MRRRHLAVSGERFVVHAAIDAPKVGDEIAEPESSIHERIEEPDLDVGVCAERSKRRIEAARVGIVQKHAYANAALGCLPHGVE